MKAKFFLERVLKDGQEYYKVLRWEGVKGFKELPDEYQNADNCFWLCNDWVILDRIGFPPFHFDKNCLVSKLQWDTEILPALKQAGERLSKILKDREEYSDLKRLAKFILDKFPDIKLNHFNNTVDIAIRLLKQYKLTQERPIIWTTNPDEELPTECYIARDLYLIKKEIKSSWSGKVVIEI